MPNDDLAPGTSGGSATGRVTCEFCKCGLAADGGVLKRSERAKALMDLEDDLAKTKKELVDVTRAHAKLDEQLTAAKAELANRPAVAHGRQGDDADPWN
jgi:hypothetical protein